MSAGHLQQGLSFDHWSLDALTRGSDLMAGMVRDSREGHAEASAYACLAAMREELSRRGALPAATRVFGAGESRQ